MSYLHAQIIAEIDNVGGGGCSGLLLLRYLYFYCLFFALLLDEQLLHLGDVRARWLPLGNLESQTLQLGEVALAHVKGVLV